MQVYKTAIHDIAGIWRTSGGTPFLGIAIKWYLYHLIKILKYFIRLVLFEKKIAYLLQIRFICALY